ncbi:MAG: hypothetical protein DCC49_03545 [Acidobacteria bacterium]|nr:MAG: hypothetical protein DCC49_03545 [Acidobacteriota bacterium]
MTESHATTLELRDYLGILRRRKWFIILPTVVILVAAITASLLTTPIYEASADVLIQSNKRSSVIADVAMPAEDPARELQTQIQVITSRPVAEETAKRLQLNVPPEAIQARVTAQVLGQTSIIRVRARDASASLARDIANGVSATYIDLRRKSALDSFAQQANDLQQKVDEATAELQQRDAELADAISKTRGEKTSDTGSQALVATLTNRREQAAAVQSFWKTALDKLQIQSNLQTSSAETVAPATLPTAPVEPKLSRKVIFALTIGILLGAGIAFLVEYLDDSLRSKQDAEKAFGAPILGMIPRAQSWNDRRSAMLLSVKDPASTTAEAYRSVRTNLQFSLLDSGSRVVLVTSPSASEGKSTTAANIAVVLAQSGKSVIIVDCDLRRPRVHKFFELRNTEGVTTAILAERPLVDLLQRPRIAGAPPSLLALTSGPIPPNPADLLGSARVSELIETLGTLADYVVIDSPPIVPLSDAAVLAPKTDGAIIVAKAGQSSRRASAQAAEKLDAVGAELLGVVLNEVTPNFGEPGYYYDYYYYYQSYRPIPEKQGSKRGGGRRSKDSGGARAAQTAGSR